MMAIKIEFLKMILTGQVLFPYQELYHKYTLGVMTNIDIQIEVFGKAHSPS